MQLAIFLSSIDDDHLKTQFALIYWGKIYELLVSLSVIYPFLIDGTQSRHGH